VSPSNGRATSLDYAGVNQAPAWLSYASPGIALLALSVSLATFIRQGGRVGGTYWGVREPGRRASEHPSVTVFLTNKGLSPVQVIGLEVVDKVWFFLWSPRNFVEIVQQAGPELPHTLAPYSTQQWTVRIGSSRRGGAEGFDDIWKGHMIVRLRWGLRLAAHLGNGMTVAVKQRKRQIPLPSRPSSGDAGSV
jgi:hypothetical protein